MQIANFKFKIFNSQFPILCLILGCFVIICGCGALEKRISQSPASVPQTDATLKAQANFCTGVYYMLGGQWRTAAHFFETATELQPHEERILHHLAACYFQLEDKEKALQTLERLAELRPNEFNIQYLFANLCEMEGKTDKAILGYERAIKCKLGNEHQGFLADVYYRLGHLYTKKNDFQKALNFYSKLMETGVVNEPAKLHCEIGQTYLQSNDVKKAMDAFKKASELDPSLVLVHFYLAICYEALGDNQKAISETEMYLAQYPDSWITLLGLAELYEKTKQKEKFEPIEHKALTILKRNVNEGSKNSDEYLVLAQLLRKRNHKEEALQVLKRAATMPLDNEAKRDVHYNLANLYYETNRYDMVEEELKTTLEIDPNCHQAYNFLGYFYVERGINLDEAIQLIKKALDAEPKNGAYLDSLGWAYYKKTTIEDVGAGLPRPYYELALENLTQASQYTEDPLILEHLGEVYYSLGRWEKAEEIWEKAIKLQKADKPAELSGVEDTKEAPAHPTDGGSSTIQNIREKIEKLQYLKTLEGSKEKVVSNYIHES